MFAPGVNETQNGRYIFDEKAAKSVMASYLREGVELMIDLEHDSLNKAARAARSDAGNALGWFVPEVRSDGSLWATNVRWTPDGAARLTNRTQRYISPAFATEEADGGERVLAIRNCALCAMPATHGTAALVAASKPAVPVRSPRVIKALSVAARVRAATFIEHVKSTRKSKRA